MGQSLHLPGKVKADRQPGKYKGAINNSVKPKNKR